MDVGSEDGRLRRDGGERDDAHWTRVLAAAAAAAVAMPGCGSDGAPQDGPLRVRLQKGEAVRPTERFGKKMINAI